MGVLLWGEDFRTTKDPRLPARKAMDRALGEKAWQAKVLGRARECGWSLVYHHFPGQFSNGRWLSNTNREGVGFPDVLGIRSALMVALELKTEAKKPAPEQTVWLDGFAALPGCVAMWARPRDWEVVADVLARPWAYLPGSERWVFDRSTEGVSDGAGQ